MEPCRIILPQGSLLEVLCEQFAADGRPLMLVRGLRHRVPELRVFRVQGQLVRPCASHASAHTRTSHIRRCQLPRLGTATGSARHNESLYRPLPRCAHRYGVGPGSK